MTAKTNHGEDPLRVLKRAFEVALNSDWPEDGVRLDGATYELDDLIEGLWDCRDVMPPELCRGMDVPEGAAYAVGARLLGMVCGGEPPIAHDSLGDASSIIPINRNVRWYQRTREVEILQSLWPFIAPALRVWSSSLHLSDEELWRATLAFADIWDGEDSFGWELAQQLRTGWRPNSRPKSEEKECRKQEGDRP